MSTTRPPDDYCRATRRDGSPCQGRALADTGLCFAHSAATKETRGRGGRNRSNAARSLKALPARLQPVADLLADALDEVHSGALDPRAASAMAALAGAYVRVLAAGEIEARLAALEAALAGRGVGRPA